MNAIASDIRNKLSETISKLLLVLLAGPPVSTFIPENYVKVRLRDNETKKAVAPMNKMFNIIFRIPYYNAQ